MQPKPVSKHTRPRPGLGVAGLPRNPTPNARTRNPGQKLRGKAGTGAQSHAPYNPARNGGVTVTQTQTQTPHNNRKPSVHSPGTQAAPAMQVTWPNDIRRPEKRLHPKACAVLGLEAERATPKHPGTRVPRTCMHALGTGYARKSAEALGFRPKEGTWQARGHTLQARQVCHAGGHQPSRCCPGLLSPGPPVRSSGM